MRLIYKLQKRLFTFLGDIKVFGRKHPMWFYINAHGYKLKGASYRSVINLIKPGDILLRRFDGYLSSFFIPGLWKHSGLYIGNDGDKPEQVVHSISDGVIQEDLLNFMRTDHMLILRLIHTDETTIPRVIETAKSIVGKPYDFGFDFENSDRFSCTELVAYCYPRIAVGKIRFGKERIVADDFYNSPKLKTIWDSHKENQ